MEELTKAFQTLGDWFMFLFDKLVIFFSNADWITIILAIIVAIVAFKIIKFGYKMVDVVMIIASLVFIAGYFWVVMK